MDNLTKERRSWNMSRIKGANTCPERKIRSILHRMGYRFRLHRKDLPGKPDITLPKYKTVVFVHGCFWHLHKGCKDATLPKTRRNFWRNKLEGNAARDRQKERALRILGWSVIVFWECELLHPEKVALRLDQLLGQLSAKIQAGSLQNH